MFCRGQVSIALHFINPGPDSPPRIDCAQRKTTAGRQKWLGATFILPRSRSSWGPADPWAGSHRPRLTRHRDIARTNHSAATPPYPSAVAAAEGIRRRTGWHHCHKSISSCPGPRACRANVRAGAAYVQLAQGSSELRLAELKYGKLLTQVSAVHRQMPWSFWCLRARQLGKDVKSKRISLQWSDSASKFGSTLKTKTNK